MSFIDCFKHEHIGFIATVPLYLPQQEITGEFEAKSNAVLFGGGSGELDAWVLSPEDVLSTVLDYYIYGTEITDDEKLKRFGITEDEYYDLLEKMIPEETAYPLANKNFYWGGDTWFDIMNHALEEGYTKEGYGFVENWMIIKAGEKLIDIIVDRCDTVFSDSDMIIIDKVKAVIKA